MRLVWHYKCCEFDMDLQNRVTLVLGESGCGKTFMFSTLKDIVLYNNAEESLGEEYAANPMVIRCLDCHSNLQEIEEVTEFWHGIVVVDDSDWMLREYPALTAAVKKATDVKWVLLGQGWVFDLGIQGARRYTLMLDEDPTGNIFWLESGSVDTSAGMVRDVAATAPIYLSSWEYSKKTKRIIRTAADPIVLGCASRVPENTIALVAAYIDDVVYDGRSFKSKFTGEDLGFEYLSSGCKMALGITGLNFKRYKGYIDISGIGARALEACLQGLKLSPVTGVYYGQHFLVGRHENLNISFDGVPCSNWSEVLRNLDNQKAIAGQRTEVFGGM